MKKLQLYLIAGLTLIAGSCKENYLNVDPIDRYSYYNFPNNSIHIDQIITGAYRKVFNITNSQLWIWGEMMSDNSTFRYNPNDRGGLNLEQVEEFVANSDNGTFNTMYQESYDGIFKSNQVLANLDKITFASETEKKTKEAEVKFFRAWHYFNLVRIYGDVPVIKEIVITPDANVATRFPRIEVNKVIDETIIPDVKSAAENLPKPSSTLQKGRLTQGAALMLYAKVLMHQNKLAEAATVLTPITSLGYKLNAEYAQNFDPLFKNGPESIYEIQADPALNVSFGFMSSFTPWGTGTTVWPGGSNSRGGLNQPTAELNNLYEKDDKRKAVTIGTSGTILYLKKFAFWDPLLKANACNFPMYRYADALLMLAECQNETGNLTGATTLVNQIRQRAGLPKIGPDEKEAALKVSTKEAMTAAIEREENRTSRRKS
jgi:starch-binding outer membrane protein, SusD/RagB family